uniref:Uncharacterized protein n=1 Tax=Oryza barthii TaxID=65489 RepID=A0A0D3FZI2_9ORYZ
MPQPAGCFLIWESQAKMSMLSILMVPSLGSTIRKSTCTKVDFPLPVRPTIPTVFSAGITQVAWQNGRSDGSSCSQVLCSIYHFLLVIMLY